MWLKEGKQGESDCVRLTDIYGTQRTKYMQFMTESPRKTFFHLLFYDQAQDDMEKILRTFLKENGKLNLG